MEMIDFESLYGQLANEMAGNQKRIPVDSALAVYLGVSPDGFLRLSFMSSQPSPKLESTKTLRISQGAESTTVYWTCFDMLQNDARKLFFTFCGTLIEVINGDHSEKSALAAIKKRYLSWKAMFRKDTASKISKESLQGLFGELYFLKNYMVKVFGADRAINSWSGPDNKSKDFSVGQEWFEVKTIGANTQEVHISSLAQLSSGNIGRLVIIKTEAMSQEFQGSDVCIDDLFKSILSMITNEDTEMLFLSKVSTFGLDSSDDSFITKFDVKSMNKYIVDESFPRIQESDIKYPEIINVRYSLSISSLKKHLEVESGES